MSEEKVIPQTEEQDILKRVIEREKKEKQKEEVRLFLDTELKPEKFGPAKETAEYLKSKGLMEEIFKRSPELELLALGTNRDADKLRDVVLKRGQELVALKEKEDEANRVKAELEKAKQPPVPAKPGDVPIQPTTPAPSSEPQLIYAWEKDFATRLKEVGVSDEKIQLALLSGRDY